MGSNWRAANPDDPRLLKQLSGNLGDTAGERWFVGRGRLVIGCDLRGHGLSDKPHDPSAYADSAMVQDTLTLLDHVGVEKVDMVGYSLGARIALRLSALAPHRLRRAVLGGLPSRSREQGEAIALRLLGDRMVQEWIADFFAGFAAAVAGNDPQALAACIRGDWYAPTDTELHTISVPLLFAAGVYDELNLAGKAEVIASKIPAARFHWLPRRNHVSAVPDRGFKEVAQAFFDLGS